MRAVRIVTLMGTSLLTLSFLATGCNSGGNEDAYKPKPAYSGNKATMPAVPSIVKKPIKVGDTYTIWGAAYYLRSRVHSKEVDGKDLKISGYIIKTNLMEAPLCAVHKTGKEDPEDCKAPVPAFWIADSKDAKEKDAIKVLGWASNFAQIYDAIGEYKKREGVKQVKESEPLTDNFWGVKIPDPLPNVGAKVTVTGNYATTFTRATHGTVADPIMGVLTYSEMSYQEPPTETATLPGMH
ncbi:MAG TPA: hypothetical protein VL137_17840 [Polyangiaceae bacterium]|jgi:hypothetical protein|nr:hypothetical protein [Polyangiaceae bacterium]